jgi:hypothetical protein
VISELLDLGNNARKLVTQAVSSHKFDWARDIISQGASFFTDIFTSARDQARKRGALKSNLVEHFKTIAETKEKIGQWKLDETLRDGAKAADSLPENRDGDYEARDWTDFAVRCKEALNRRYDAAQARSDELYNSITQVFKQRIVSDFETLCDDGAKLIAWLNEIDRNFSDLQSIIGSQADISSNLAVGPMRDGIAAVITTLRGLFTASFGDYSKMKEDIAKEMDQQ